jgi:tetratricopeptide (TPR) repeat protein
VYYSAPYTACGPWLDPTLGFTSHWRHLRIARRTLVCLLGLLTLARADDYESLFRQAASLSADGKYGQAIEEYKAALRLRPGAAEALNNLAVMYYAAHRYAEAFEAAAGIWKNHPEMESAALITGMAAVQCNRPRDAIEPLNKLLAKDPGSRDAVLALASAHVALNQLTEAARIYQGRTTQAPTDADAWYGQAICYERMAEEASHKLSRMPGGAGYSKRLLGEFLLSMGDSRLAREAFGESLAAPAAATSEAAAQYTVTLKLAGKSRQAFERFVSLSPDSWQADLFRADVERQHGALPAALELYQKAAAQQPENPAPLLGMGTVYWELGQYDDAEKCLRDTLRLNARSEQAAFELANIAVRRHRYDDAIPLLQNYLSARPDALAARADLGLAYVHTGQFRNAVEELSKALDSDAKGDIHYQMSVALRKLGRTAEADRALRKSVEIRDAALQREQRLLTDR